MVLDFCHGCCELNKMMVMNLNVFKYFVIPCGVPSSLKTCFLEINPVIVSAYQQKQSEIEITLNKQNHVDVTAEDTT